MAALRQHAPRNSCHRRQRPDRLREVAGAAARVCIGRRRRLARPSGDGEFRARGRHQAFARAYTGAGPAKQAITSVEVACFTTTMNAALKEQADDRCHAARLRARSHVRPAGLIEDRPCRARSARAGPAAGIGYAGDAHRLVQHRRSAFQGRQRRLRGHNDRRIVAMRRRRARTKGSTRIERCRCPLGSHQEVGRTSDSLARRADRERFTRVSRPVLALAKQGLRHAFVVLADFTGERPVLWARREAGPRPTRRTELPISLAAAVMVLDRASP